MWLFIVFSAFELIGTMWLWAMKDVAAWGECCDKHPDQCEIGKKHESCHDAKLKEYDGIIFISIVVIIYHILVIIAMCGWMGEGEREQKTARKAEEASSSAPAAPAQAINIQMSNTNTNTNGG